MRINPLTLQIPVGILKDLQHMEIFHGGVPVFLPSSLSSSRYYRLIDGANLNTQPPQPSSLPAPFSSSSALEGTCV